MDPGQDGVDCVIFHEIASFENNDYYASYENGHGRLMSVHAVNFQGLLTAATEEMGVTKNWP